MRVRPFASLAIIAAALGADAADDFLTNGGDIAIDVLPADGRIVMDLAGDIWMLEDGGGEARKVVESEQTLRQPRWSPGGDALLYLAESDDGGTLRIHALATAGSRTVVDDGVHNQDADWHPDGDRIVYVSDRHGSGLDVWEMDLPTGLSWRLTADPGDDFSPAWSANGRHLAWIRRDDDGFALMLRLHGLADSELLRSAAPLSSLSWRPDGSLLTFLRHGEDGVTLEMAILSDPVLVRTIADGRDFAPAPVTWRDRMNLYFTADGQIRTRGFEDRVSRPVHFRAMVAAPEPPAPPKPVPQRELSVSHAPDGRLIVRARRLFDGIWQGYRTSMDVVIDGGRIESLEPSRERPDDVVLDLGDVTAIPGLVDAAATIDDDPSSGAAILAYGVTTVIVDRPVDGFDPLVWETETTPGPRVIVLEAGELPPVISGLADGGLAALGAVHSSRQARTLGHTAAPPRRFASMRDISAIASTIAVGSRANRMPAGAGLHAELLALRSAGLTGEQVLHAAGRNAARAVGLENQVGALTPGAVADLVLVSGDPLRETADALGIVAVVRNGRFYSLVSLLERAASPGNVE